MMPSEWLQQLVQRFRTWRMQQEPLTMVGLFILFGFGTLVVLAAVFPAGQKDKADLGRWQTLIPPKNVMRLVRIDYDADTGRLQLREDKNEAQRLLNAKRERAFVEVHIAKFNAAVSGRTYRDPGLVRGERDGIFQVELVAGNGDKVVPQLKINDLSAYNLFPLSQRQSRASGSIHLRPEPRKRPFLSDGHLGFFLEPVQEEAATTRYSLRDSGLFRAERVTLVDNEGLPRASIEAREDGNAVTIIPGGEWGVFRDNNPPINRGMIVLEDGEMAEIAGRFFEASIAENMTIAVSRKRGDLNVRVYPMGDLLHVVGPTSPQGNHQPLGIEYLFQEYLAGLPAQGIPPGELWLTVDQRLQTSFVNGIKSLAKTSKRGLASGLIMNAQTGAVVAMAAEPFHYDPEDRNQIRDILNRGKEHYYNHGSFKRHAIGSVTKVFFGFIALQLWGNQALDITMDLPGTGTTTLFGHPLYGDRKRSFKLNGGRIGFSDYLIKSDNGYQHSLGLLLLSGVTDPATEIVGPWRNDRQKKGLNLTPLSNPQDDPLVFGTLGPRKGRLTVDGFGRFATTLTELFDLEISSSAGKINDRDIGIYAEPVLKMLSELLLLKYPDIASPMARLKARSVVCAPATPRMALEEIRNTMDSSNVLFGANHNLWTDVKLCESFSRIITGTKVDARIIHRYRDTMKGEIVDLEQASKENPRPLDVPNPDAFAHMRRILERVPLGPGSGYPEGTAHLLEPMVRAMKNRDPDFRLFGKTGTINDGKKDDPDSKLFVGTFGKMKDDQFVGPAFTFCIYLKAAEDQDAHLTFIGEQLPIWFDLLANHGDGRISAETQP